AVGMGISFVSDVFSASRLHSVREALSDTWTSAKHIEHNKAVIGQNLGRFAFDTGLTVAGAMAGSLAGRGISKFAIKSDAASAPGLLSTDFDARLYKSTGSQPADARTNPDILDTELKTQPPPGHPKSYLPAGVVLDARRLEQLNDSIARSHSIRKTREEV